MSQVGRHPFASSEAVWIGIDLGTQSVRAMLSPNAARSSDKGAWPWVPVLNTPSNAGTVASGRDCHRS